MALKKKRTLVICASLERGEIKLIVGKNVLIANIIKIKS
jgi:hypothetical protein